MTNGSYITEFLLLGFSEVREIQLMQFVIFLLIYLAALIGNILIITTVAADSSLGNSMYFFLANLSVMDLGYISVTMLKAMANCLMNSRLISYSECIIQVFFLFFFMASDYFLLTVMAYDRYVAICDPLHYETVVNKEAAVQMAAITWISGLFYATVHTGATFAVPFCSNIINQFFCEIPQLLKLSCNDLYLVEVVALGLSACLGLGCFSFIVVSYVEIFKTVFRIPSVQGREKAFSTCIPHLTVVFLFLFTGTFANLNPTSSSVVGLNRIITMAYCILPPVMNPIIYSMRNKEIKAGLWKLYCKFWREPINQKQSSLSLQHRIQSGHKKP
ncbi:olfactory receptor 14I1-like [Sphaerodactylus townsendi]|uniref:olfactory receptor 14I1-like n=1 Tax=Sphaerodactylus townsendi TaxID=933632 RepID=UPI0020265AA6|nr:olfactory receptor 14I1-like [Sphaerodactylus townsendi]